MQIYLNGKFLAQKITGTQRYAGELLRILVTENPGRFILVLPRDASEPDWARETVIWRSRFRGLLFEQVVLPLVSWRGFLVSLAGPAPLLKRRQLVAMHDTSVVDLPTTYSPIFVLWYKFLYKGLSKMAAQIVTVSAFSASRLSEVLSVPVSQIAVVPNGADHMRSHVPQKPDLELPPGQPFALCVGTMARHKNLQPVVKALEANGIRVVIVGAAGISRVFNEENSFNDDLVHVMGRISDGELRWLYQEATAFVFPSLYEGFGLPIVEAQINGCPVISSDSAAMPEVGGDGAVYFPPNQPEVAVGLFNRIVSDSAYREALIERGYANANQFTWMFSAERLRSVYEKIVP